MGALLVQAQVKDEKEWRHDEQEVLPGGVAAGNRHAWRDG